MNKSHIPSAFDIRNKRSESHSRWPIPLVAAGIVFIPLAFEGALCCYARWCDVFSSSVEVKTPMLDALARGVQVSQDWYGEWIAPSVELMLRDPKYALPVAVILLVFGMSLLKR